MKGKEEGRRNEGRKTEEGEEEERKEGEKGEGTEARRKEFPWMSLVKIMFSFKKWNRHVWTWFEDNSPQQS